MKCRFIAENASVWPVTILCQVLGVSRSRYYAWTGKTPSANDALNVRLRLIIREIFDAYCGIYGAPRITWELRMRGFQVNRKRVTKLMRDMNLSATAPRSFTTTTDSNHDHPIAPDLLGQDFTAERPNQKWVGDITYIATAEGWLYLATVIDLYSRRVVGWATSDSLATELPLEALRMAIRQRQPDGGLIFHSDRGCQYASRKFRAALDLHDIQPSMSRKGCCYDNAVAESFFHTLKTEWIRGHIYPTREEARLSLFAYIEAFYNTRRRHSTIGYLSPVDFENANQVAA